MSNEAKKNTRSGTMERVNWFVCVPTQKQCTYKRPTNHDTIFLFSFVLISMQLKDWLTAGQRLFGCLRIVFFTSYKFSVCSVYYRNQSPYLYDIKRLSKTLDWKAIFAHLCLYFLPKKKSVSNRANESDVFIVVVLKFNDAFSFGWIVKSILL